MTPEQELQRSDRIAIGVSRGVRWGLGLLFMGVGVLALENGGGAAIGFGLLLFVTGFFRPRRCLSKN